MPDIKQAAKASVGLGNSRMLKSCSSRTPSRARLAKIACVNAINDQSSEERPQATTVSETPFVEGCKDADGPLTRSPVVATKAESAKEKNNPTA
mmetsp:Transcript_130129/g.243415  ORF Transcript_130129/g.243415 Transcript_130129/m.243415 type:complete len:94 (+) Transcript_130129:1375-1656(+)